MGIVSEKDFIQEKSKLIPESNPSENKPVEAEIVELPSKGRGLGNVEVPDSLRRVIGETHITDGRQEAVDFAKRFGISPSSASAYGVGANSTTTYDERPNQDTIVKSKDKISKVARGKLMKALRHITDDKLNDTKARELAGIARDMSAVVKNMEDEGPKVPGGNNGPTFVFYSPQFRKEEHYDTVLAKE
jgi:hypothetical protein